LHYSSIPTPEGHNLPTYWFADERAAEIIADVKATGGKCLGQRPATFTAKWANQREEGVIFTGPLVDELQEIRRSALPLIDEAIDWSNAAHLHYYRTQKSAVTDVLLAALEWRPNGGGSHDEGLYVYFSVNARAVAA